MKKIIIFDTTLRDGEQSPGASLNFAQKMEVAEILKELNVDVIEAGFPAASPGDFEAVKTVAERIKGPAICGLCRAKKEDIDACYGAVKYSARPRIHTFLATSDIHMKYKLKMSRKEVLDMAVWAVKYASSKVRDVEFSAEDAARSDFGFLKQVVKAVIAAGAKTVNIPDTVGYSTPKEYGEIIRRLISDLKIGPEAVISVHCHNDLGLATANSISAVLNGARQVECTVNGLGERAGNASLEEIAMIIRTRQKYLNVSTDIRTQSITRASRLVSKLTGIMVQPNKAIVGQNAFAHEAGIHQHGVLAKSITYEIMTPESVGLTENKIVMGKHSGRHAMVKKLKDLGYRSLSEEDINGIFGSFKNLADRKKNIYDEDIMALAEEKFEAQDRSSMSYQLEDFNVTSGKSRTPSATVMLSKTVKNKKQTKKQTSKGDGPLDALFHAVDRITGFSGKLVDFSLKAVSSGKDAMGEAMVKTETNKGILTCHGSSTDIIEAALKAYISAVNRYFILKNNEKGKAK